MLTKPDLKDEKITYGNNEVSFKITKLGVDLYKYYAKGVETYKKGVFSGFNSVTNQNKKEKYVNITIDPKDNNLVIDGSSFKGKEDKEPKPFVTYELKIDFDTNTSTLCFPDGCREVITDLPCKVVEE